MNHARNIAAAGRNGDTVVAHLTPGETVIPRSMMTAQLVKALMGAAEETGHDLGRYVVGGPDDSRNPKTGLLEFYDSEPGMGSGIGEGSTQTGPDPSTGGGFSWDTRDEPGMYSQGTPVGPAGAQGGSGQIADLSPQDLIGIGVNPNDYSQRPDLGQRVGHFFSTIPDKISHGFRDAINNPGATALNVGLGILSPAYTVANLALNAFADKDIGKGLVGQVADWTGYNDKPSALAYSAFNPNSNLVGPTDAITADKRNDARDTPGGGDGPGDTKPFGSKDSPLVQALAGTPTETKASPVWGGRMTFGPQAFSYSPTGRQYVTPWAYRG